MRYKALIEYDGSDYHGFQRQRDDQPTIQGELEKAIGKVVRRTVSVTGAGRTDSGVHALGQVISFDVDWNHSAEALQRAVNASLPVAIAILRLQETTPVFHPRFDARRRAYAYHIYNRPVRSPIRRLRTWHVCQALDVTKMNQAALALIGVHDFATFGQAPQGDNTIREVFAASWKRRDELLIFSIEATAYLYRMVRSLVGSLKAVGDGSRAVDDFVSALQARDRNRAGSLAPPYGLYLVNVSYDE